MSDHITTIFNPATRLCTDSSITAEIHGRTVTLDRESSYTSFDDHIRVARALAEKLGVELTAGYTSTEHGYQFAIKTGVRNEN